MAPEAIGERWAGEIGGGDFELEREPKTIEIAHAGDEAYEVGTYKVAWNKPKEGQSGGATGNYPTTRSSTSRHPVLSRR